MFEDDQQWNDSNRAFIQALMARSTLTLEEAKPLLAAVQTAYEKKETLAEDITEADLNSHIAAANTRISPFDLEIRSTFHQATRKRIYALVNSTSDPIIQLATVHTADEISFLKRLLDAMFETYNTSRHEVMAITSMQAIRLAKPPDNERREPQDGSTTQGSAGQGLKLVEAEKMLKTLVEEGWFEKSKKGYYSLSPRALMELRGWLIETYNDVEDEDDDDEDRIPRVKQCAACKEIVTMTEWTGNDFVGERAAPSSNKLGRRRTAAGSGGNTSRITADETNEHSKRRSYGISTMLVLTFIGICALLLALLYKYVLEPAIFSPLARIPSPNFLSTISPIWIDWKRQANNETRTIFALHQKYGPIVRLAPNEISVNALEGLRTIYYGGFEKHDWYSDAFVNYGTRSMFTMLDRSTHTVQKRFVSNLYSKSYLHNSPDLHSVAHDLVLGKILPTLDSTARHGHPIDVFDLTQAVGMDFTTAYLLGSANGSKFLDNVEFRRHWFALYQVYYVQSPEARANGEIEQWCMSMCKAAEDMLQSEVPVESTQAVVYSKLFKCLQSACANPQQVRRMAAAEVLDQLIAGHETSAITTTYLMYEMSQDPSLQSKLREELLNLSPPLRYPSGDRLPAPKDIDALTLLDAILLETLRVYSAAAAPQPRVTPEVPGGINIGGYSNIPGGVRVSSNAYSIHRIAEVFPDPDVWSPERWLTTDEKKLEQMRRCFFAFGAGGRMCIGSHFAIQGTVTGFLRSELLDLMIISPTVMKLVVTAIYSNFTTSIAEDSNMEQIDSFVSRPSRTDLVPKLCDGARLEQFAWAGVEGAALFLARSVDLPLPDECQDFTRNFIPHALFYVNNGNLIRAQKQSMTHAQEHMALNDPPEAYEERHVHQVYEQIALHFSSTRYKPWPIVERFLRELPNGSVGIDVGCGNGKYLAVNPNIFIVASDRTLNLVKIASQHQPHTSLVADNLCLPHPSSSFDFAISIAVVHHLSTRPRRVQAIAAVLQTLRSPAGSEQRQPDHSNLGGKALIYVWALEQKTSRRGWDEGHEQDVMVPWVMKKPSAEHDSEGSKTFNRYYHLYRRGELESDIVNAGGNVLESGYEKDNWWAIAVR
ncbi:MAG: hypothetical protein Q9181_006340 [Wetmoreana brouardii]